MFYIIVFLQAIIIVFLAIDTYLLYKSLSEESKKEVLRKVYPIKSDVIEWKPPEDEEEKTSRELTEEITKKGR
jgi:hypothetical protein